MEYTLTDKEQPFVNALKATLIQAKAAVREASVAAAPHLAKVKQAEDDEARIQATFDGALKMLMNANGMETATLTADSGKLVSQ